MKARAVVLLDQRRSKVGEKYPVKLRVTFNREQKYYPLGIDLTVEQFGHLSSSNLRGDNKKWHDKVVGAGAKANNIIDKMVIFSFEAFSKEYNDTRIRKDLIADAFKTYIDQLNRERRVKTRISYEYALRSLLLFKNDLTFQEVSVRFLKEYEQWMYDNGKSPTTVGYYLRPLKAILNTALTEKLIHSDAYPFGKGKYQIPSAINIKKSLTTEEICRILAYKPAKGTSEEKALDFWTFSFFCNGINFKDIAYLKTKNIQGDSIRLVREKTKNTYRVNAKPVVIYLHPVIKEIIDKHGRNSNDPEDFVFQILNSGDSEEVSIKLVAQFIQNTNKWMKRIAKKVDVGKVVTTYVARHSFATSLLRLDKPVEFISEMINHQSIPTTTKYLAGFEDDDKRNAINELVSLLKPN